MLENAAARRRLMLQAATNVELGYVMSLPDGFVSSPLSSRACGMSSAVPKGSQSSPGSFVLCVQRMHATVGRERLKSSDLPASSRSADGQWQGLDIDAIRTTPRKPVRRSRSTRHRSRCDARRFKWLWGAVARASVAS